MTKPIGKSKRQLARLLIEVGVTQFPEGANWAAQDGDKDVDFFEAKPVRELSWWQGDYDYENRVSLSVKIHNWHQTVLSRDEFDQIVAETAPDADGWIEWNGGECPVDCGELVVCIVRSGKEWRNGRAIKAEILRWRHTGSMTDIIAYRLHKPEPVKSTAVGDDETNLAAKEELEALELTPTPTLDQLLQDWRNADDYAKRKQTEADEAAAMRDERWQAVQARAGEMGVTVGRCESVVGVVDAEFAPNNKPIRDWICIFDCEPIEEKTYIIHTECGTVTTGVWFYHKRKFMNSCIDGWVEEKVIDWMPLPKAP